MEDVFPEPAGLLSASGSPSAAQNDSIIVLDTNALLLPFNVNKQDLPQIETVYRELAKDGRLFVPARVMREFIKNRDVKLAEISKALHDKGSNEGKATVDIPPLLAGLEETIAVAAASKQMDVARSAYIKAIGNLAAQIKGWRGNDPVTSVYRGIFVESMIVDHDEERTAVEEKWRQNLKRKIPPGYKDGSKSDTGIGDFLVWLSILKLARIHKKNLIFVTGEEKADWFVRANGGGVYPRPELIDEYRRESAGQHLRLAKLADILLEMNAPAGVVSEVRDAETAANSAIQTLSTHAPEFSSAPIASATTIFDYSANNGEMLIFAGTTAFCLRFSRGSDKLIHVYRVPATAFIAEVPFAPPGMVIDIDKYDRSSASYLIEVGKIFVARNSQGFTLVARIQRITDKTRGYIESDTVQFNYDVFAPGQQIVAPAYVQ